MAEDASMARPNRIEGPQAWVSADMEDQGKWLSLWDDSEVAEMR